MAETKSDAATRAAGHAVKLRKGNTYLELLIALAVIEPMELLNKSMQAKQNTVSAMKEAVRILVVSLTHNRQDDDIYDGIWVRVRGCTKTARV